jgi:hypothetical protein
VIYNANSENYSPFSNASKEINNSSLIEDTGGTLKEQGSKLIKSSHKKYLKNSLSS